MKDVNFAERIGYHQAFKAITIGLVIAYFIMALLAGPLWIFEFTYAPTILFAVAMIYLTGYVLGGMAGRVIIKKKWPAILVGIISGFLMVWIATFLGSMIGFINEGLKNESSADAFHDYIIKPVGLVTFFGGVPIIVVGIWFGLSIKSKAKVNSNVNR